MKYFVAVLSNLVVLSLVTACSGGFTSVKNNSSAPEVSDLSKKLAAHTWCNVQDNGQPFNRDVALAYTFKADGSLNYRSLNVERADEKIIKPTETTQDGTWTIDKNVMSIRNGTTGEVLTSRIEFVEVEPSVPADVVWKAGVATTKQTCLKTEQLDNKEKFGIHCPCDYEQIVTQAKAAQN